MILPEASQLRAEVSQIRDEVRSTRDEVHELRNDQIDTRIAVTKLVSAIQGNGTRGLAERVADIELEQAKRVPVKWQAFAAIASAPITLLVAAILSKL